MIVCNSYHSNGWNLQPAMKMWADPLSLHSNTQLKTKDTLPLFGNLAPIRRSNALGRFAQSNPGGGPVRRMTVSYRRYRNAVFCH